MSPKITCTKNFYHLKIYINTILHISITLSNYDSIQSWYDTSTSIKHCIKIYTKVGQGILLEYQDFKVWKKILDLLDKNL